MFFFGVWPRSWQKERVNAMYNFLAIRLVYSPKWAFLIGYHDTIKLPQEFWIKRNEFKFNCSVTSKIQKVIMMNWRQNVLIGVCNGAALEKAILEGQSTGGWGRVRHIDASSVVSTLKDNGKWANQRLVAVVVKIVFFTWDYKQKSLSKCVWITRGL